ncbi:hypothetical protein HDU87_002781 [Geranomyces variabilis]|uniref:Transmembrane protein n=1 Tax=Geranomyces variabilis TaxID=109894 RepID=A0AAD5TQW4_9FUNG|nr:hypothetical protein HDU87_002781 [Geranomyces variabilis]
MTSVPPKRRWHVSLAALLLGTMVVVACSIAIPVAVLAFLGASGTVSDIVTDLRGNYVQQVQQILSSTTTVLYELVQSNADNLSINFVLDSHPNGTTLLNYPDLLYSYEKSIERSDFLISAGFNFVGSHDAVLVAPVSQPGFVCWANSTMTYGRSCNTLFVNNVLDGTLNISLAPAAPDKGQDDIPVSVVGQCGDPPVFLDIAGISGKDCHLALAGLMQAPLAGSWSIATNGAHIVAA